MTKTPEGLGVGARSDLHGSLGALMQQWVWQCQQRDPWPFLMSPPSSSGWEHPGTWPWHWHQYSGTPRHGTRVKPGTFLSSCA